MTLVIIWSIWRMYDIMWELGARSAKTKEPSMQIFDTNNYNVRYVVVSWDDKVMVFYDYDGKLVKSMTDYRLEAK